jgi:hypothetical protein
VGEAHVHKLENGIVTSPCQAGNWQQRCHVILNVAQVCFAFARQLPLLEWELGCFWMWPELHNVFGQTCKFANKMAAERILHTSRAAQVNNALTTSHAHNAWRKFARHCLAS